MKKRCPEITQEKMIDEIIEHFDFKKCNQVMDTLNWGWVTTGGVPTINDLKEAARKRLESAINGVLSEKNKHLINSSYFSSSGGLKASVIKNKYNHITNLNLEFVLAEWDSDGDE